MTPIFPEGLGRLSPQTRRSRRDALALRYGEVRAQSERLALPLSPEDSALQSMPDASPVKWHLAHTSWFFEMFVLEKSRPDYVPFHPMFRTLFNSYYVALGPRHPRPERGLLSRPALGRVHDYRRYIDDAMNRLFDNFGNGDPALLDTIELGLHHEQQHQELILTDLKHLFSRNPLRPVYIEREPLPPEPPAPSLDWFAVPAGLRQIGHGSEGFCFDNEQPRHRAFVAAFEIASRPVTNGEFLEFIAEGGYQRPELWLSEGWDTRATNDWNAPLYWHWNGSAWTVYTLHGDQPLREAEPVCHVSYFEADAYARWAGCRLPDETEWETFAAARDVQGNLLESGLFHPEAAPSRAGEMTACQVFGDVWEWTRSSYAPYAGYHPPEGAVGEYNGKFMVNQYVLRGGSCATPESHIRATYRNFFPASARWQFSGIRLARDLSP